MLLIDKTVLLGVTLGVLVGATARYGALASRLALPLTSGSHNGLSRIGVPLLIVAAGVVMEAVCNWRIPIDAIAFNGIAVTGLCATLEGALLPALASWFFMLLHSPVLGFCVLLPMCLCLYRAMFSPGRVGGCALRIVAATACYSAAVAIVVVATELSRAQEFPGLHEGLALPTLASSALVARHVGKEFEQAWAARGVAGVLSALQHALPMASVDAGSPWQPELSLMWYVSSAAFTRYLPYYRLIFIAHPLLYVLPVCWRLRHRPDLAVVVAAGLAAVFDPSAYWALARFPLVAACMAAHRQVVARMTRGVPHLWLGLLGAAVVAAPAMKHAWLTMLSGNANLLFNMALAVAVAGGSLLAEFSAAALRAQKVQRRLLQAEAAAAGQAGATQAAAVGCGAQLEASKSNTAQIAAATPR